MVRKYKKKRLVIENNLDQRPNKVNLEGSERMSAKKEIKKELEEEYEIKIHSEGEADEA